MAKTRTQYVCEACGAAQPRWTGRCGACSAWNTIKEQAASPFPEAASRRRPAVAQPGAALRSRSITTIGEGPGEDGLLEAGRLLCRIPAFDRVLGGGLLRGSLVLLGGDPGVGKSTLLLQALAGLCDGGAGAVLYASGEESLGQTAMRARRLEAARPGLHLLCETGLTAILEEADRLRPAVLAIDSIQMLFVDGVEGLPGSLVQVREATSRLLPWAKDRGVATILIGHVTKEGAIAGPKTLEHLVDAVLLFEGERGHPYRVLRASKNRFGATSELGVFQMSGGGLREVPDPSALFLRERQERVPGSAVTATVEGSLPLLLEVQALVAQAAGVPRRNALGVDPYRVAMILAVLERRAGIDVLNLDVFVNVAGGLKLSEPAADLAVAVALASSATRRPVDPTAVCFGELGLVGEVRAVGQAELRLGEARKLGFRRAVLPAEAAASLGKQVPGLELVGVRDLGAAIDALLISR